MKDISIETLTERLADNEYPGRGIAVGMTQDGKHAGIAYFIMGRSANSRNRVLVREGDSLYTRPFDESKVKDPSLIIYRAARFLADGAIVTNGDQTDTIYDAITRGESFAAALGTRTYEPDSPNYTPRISAMLRYADAQYTMSILKRNADTGECIRAFYPFKFRAGEGHLLHTYESDGEPLPSFVGAPRKVAFPNDLDAFGDEIWNALHEENKISLFVCFVDVTNGTIRERIYNKNEK